MFTATALRSGSKSEQYADLAEQARGLLHGERDRIANAANFSALVFGALPDLNWVGFYFYDGNELVVGPFQGKPACVRIALGRGVCGTAAVVRQSQGVCDVEVNFPAISPAMRRRVRRSSCRSCRTTPCSAYSTWTAPYLRASTPPTAPAWNNWQGYSWDFAARRLNAASEWRWWTRTIADKVAAQKIRNVGTQVGRVAAPGRRAHAGGSDPGRGGRGVHEGQARRFQAEPEPALRARRRARGLPLGRFCPKGARPQLLLAEAESAEAANPIKTRWQKQVERRASAAAIPRYGDAVVMTPRRLYRTCATTRTAAAMRRTARTVREIVSISRGRAATLDDSTKSLAAFAEAASSGHFRVLDKLRVRQFALQLRAVESPSPTSTPRSWPRRCR